MDIIDFFSEHVPTGATKERSYDGDYMKLGKEGERIVLNFLQRRPQVVGVEDFRDLRVMREADVDCAIKTRDGRISLAEIKSDSWLGISTNILCEVMRINHTCRPEMAGYLGWAFRSPAQWLLYYAPAARQIWQIKFDALRQVIQQYSQRERKNLRFDIVATDSLKTTFNLLIPENEFVGKLTKLDL